jgi:4-hydroxybutyrate CoA-transferase
MFLGPPTRDPVRDARATFTPCFFSEVPRLFRERILPIDAVILQVTEPDGEGYCSLGLSADFTLAATECAPLVLAQVNRLLPRTGGARIHLDHISAIVVEDSPIPEVFAPKIGELEMQIGRHVASLVEDGATLQIGIGAIPEAALLCLHEKKDLGIHSEMFSDGVVTLAQAGVITNRRKTLNPDKFVATFLMGTRRLYDWAQNNPALEMLPVDYVNDPSVIGQHDKMISLNSALQVDLLGQVNAEMIGARQYSGVGGQVDFLRGASRSRGGRGIIALPSTARQGTISRICTALDTGAAVTSSRQDVHFVVTEYGVAELRGKTLQQRAEALINIAHPAHRAGLRLSAGSDGRPARDI